MGGSVCIISDNEDMGQVLSHVVRSAGLTGVLYDSAQSFLQRADDGPIGCIVVDVPLRGNGEALLQTLTATGNDWSVFLVGDARSHVSAAAAGRSGAIVVDKPFDARLLAQRIRDAVNPVR